MAQLAIKGHPTRGKEVIETLEMLGGKNSDCSGKNIYAVYSIPNNSYIYPYQYAHQKYPDDFIIFTLEEFLEKYPYKVGDKVVVKGLPEYPKSIHFMKWFDDNIHYSFDNETWFLPSALNPYKEETMEEDMNYCKTGKITTVIFQEQNYEDKVELDLGDNYEIKVEDGKTYVVKKKSQFPSTVKECCEVLGILNHARNGIAGYMSSQIWALQKLFICRDAYWKLYGEQMGLGKPWKPKLDNNEKIFYIHNVSGKIYVCEGVEIENQILAFPTEEMRDVFYENFKDLIEQCKELL